MRIMNLGFKSLGWYLSADILVIISWRIWKPDWIERERITSLLVASILLWFFLDRRQR